MRPNPNPLSSIPHIEPKQDFFCSALGCSALLNIYSQSYTASLCPVVTKILVLTPALFAKSTTFQTRPPAHYITINCQLIISPCKPLSRGRPTPRFNNFVRSSVRPSVRLSVRPSVRLHYGYFYPSWLLYLGPPIFLQILNLL